MSRERPFFRHSALVYPGILVALFVILVVAGVSGSSMAYFSQTARDPGLVLGSPQRIRSDEYVIHTPNFIGQVKSGERSIRLHGVGEHDLAVIGDLPTRDWSGIFQPDNVPAPVLSPANALAWHWWLPVLISALAFYGIAQLCGFGAGLSASVSMLISFSPLVEWWHLSTITGSLGFGSAAFFSILKALRAESRVRIFLWSLSSFYWMMAFCLVLYPPFQISTLLALVPITIALILADIEGKRYTWTRAFACVGAIALVTGCVLAVFFVAHGDAISAIRGTVYPGSRRSTGGTGSLAQLFSANFSAVLSHAQSSFAGTNLSEFAAPYLLAAESLTVLILAGWRRKNATARNVAVAAAGSLAVGLAWHQLPVPSWAGRFLLLDFVPPQRVLPLIGISGVFLFAVLVHSQVAWLSRRRRSVVGLAVATTTLVPALFEAKEIKNLLPALSLTALVAVAVLGAAAVASLTVSPNVWGTGAVAIVVGLSFFSVNPLYRGTGPLEDSAMTKAVRRAGADATWVNYGGLRLEALLAASGASSLSGVNYYPNSEAWKVLLGGTRDEAVWNRYLETRWLPGSARANVRLNGAAAAIVRLAPCAPQLTSFGVTRVLAKAGTFTLKDTCLRRIDSSIWQGIHYVIYARSG